MTQTQERSWEQTVRDEVFSPYPGNPSPRQVTDLKLRKRPMPGQTHPVWVQKKGEVIFNPARTVAIRLRYPTEQDSYWRVECIKKGPPEIRTGTAFYKSNAENGARDRVAIWWQEHFRN